MDGISRTFQDHLNWQNQGLRTELNVVCHSTVNLNYLHWELRRSVSGINIMSYFSHYTVVDGLEMPHHSVFWLTLGRILIL